MSAHDADTVRSIENGQPNRRQQKRRGMAGEPEPAVTN